MIELAKAPGYEALLQVIRHTPYYNVLKGIEPFKDGHIPYTKCEVALRTYYHKWLFDTAEKELSGNAGAALSEQELFTAEEWNLQMKICPVNSLKRN